MNRIELAKKIKSGIEENHLALLEEENLLHIFRPVYKLQNNIRSLNALVVYIVYAYTNESPWLDVRKDRLENKKNILSGLEIKMDDFFKKIIDCEHGTVNEVIADWLTDQATWQFRQVLVDLDYHQRMMKFVGQHTDSERQWDELNKDGEKHTLTEEYNLDTVAKINKEKGLLLKQAMEARERADETLRKLKKDFVQLENAVQQDFDFSITDEKKIDPMSWKDFIKHKVIPERTKLKSL